MLNNKKTFDVLTPLSKTHRVSRHIATTDGTNPITLVTEPGLWVQNTAEGVTSKSVTALSGLSMIGLSSATDNPYESNDIEVGYISTLREPGVRVIVGLDFLDNTYAGGPLWNETAGEFDSWAIVPGEWLTVLSSGKLGKAGSGDFANAIVDDLNKNGTLTYIITDGMSIKA